MSLFQIGTGSGLFRRQRRRRTGYRASESLPYRDIVIVQRLAGGRIQLYPGFAVSAQRIDLGGLGYGQIALYQDDIEDRGGAQRVLLLLCVQCLFTQDARLRGGFIGRPRLLQGDQRVLDIHPHLVLLLLNADLPLTDGQLIQNHVGLGGPVPQRNIQIDRRIVVREIAAEELPQDGTVSADEIRSDVTGGLPWKQRKIAHVSGQPVVVEVDRGVQAGQKLAARALQIDLVVNQPDLLLGHFGARAEGFGHHVLNGPHGLGLRDLNPVGGNDAGFRYRRTRHAIAAQRILEDGFLLQDPRLGDGQILLGSGQLGFRAHDFDGRQRADFHLFLVIAEQLLVQIHGLLVHLHHLVEADQVPIQTDDGRDDVDYLLLEHQIGYLAIVPGDRNVARVDGTAKPLQQTLGDAQAEAGADGWIEIVPQSGGSQPGVAQAQRN